MGVARNMEALFEVEEAPAPSRARVPAGSAKTFRHYDQDQSFLLPPSLDDWLPEGHEARFVSEVVEDLLELAPIYDAYLATDGAPPYDPRMMLKLLFYAYSTGVTSSRAIERRCIVDVAFRFLSANQSPDYRSIARFRRRHLEAIEELFIQVLALCAGAGLVRLGRVALDGTKLKASASKHKAMSYERMGPKIEQLKSEVTALLEQAEQADTDEDGAFGEDRRGDEIPAELLRREARLSKLRAAKEALEKEAAEKAAEQAAEQAMAKGESEEEVAAAEAAAAAEASPKPTAQRSFTDPEARMMKTNDGFAYAFNAQAMVDEASQVILAPVVTQQASDIDQLLPMIEAATTRLAQAGIEARPRLVLADAGYCSEDNLAALEVAEIDALVATGRLRRDEQVPAAPKGRIPDGLTRRERMARRLRTKKGRKDYARRKAIVEPIFGQMKVRQNAGQLRLRGLDGARGEWTLHSLCHNLRKLRNARTEVSLRAT